MRTSGILLPAASLPGNYGIGGFSEEAFCFADFLAEAGQSWWQILPLGPTGYGDSPYQSFSTFAGNPYYISLDGLVKEGLLTAAEAAEADCGQYPDQVDYERIWKTRFTALRRAYARFVPDEAYAAFCRDNRDWLEDYCLYCVIKEMQDHTGWLDWPAELRDRDPAALKKIRDSREEELSFWRFQQFVFRKQWDKLKAYVNKKGICVIGDVPIYVAMDSADAWASPELFQFDENHKPEGVAGCPPDAFSPTGQLWGNPLYRWDYHRKTGYSWWLSRMRHAFRIYDKVRIDHFRGFEAYYSIPYGDPTAEFGHWEKGPGADFFHTLEEHMGRPDLIAEDLGFLTEEVHELLRETGYPGMKVLQFAFGSGPSNAYLPHNYTRNCVVYTGTHDNETTLGWYMNAPEWLQEEVKQYTGLTIGADLCPDSRRASSDGTDSMSGKSEPCPKPDSGIGTNEASRRAESRAAVRALISQALGSVADLAVIPMQDYLELGNEARINFPSTLGENWKWRLLPGQCTPELARHIRHLTEVYGRMQK